MMTKERFTEIVTKYNLEDADMTELAEAVTKDNSEGDDYKVKYEELKKDYIDRFFGGGDEKDDTEEKDEEEKDSISLADLMKEESEAK